MFLLIGFYYYVLIELQGAVEKEGGDDGLEVINDDEKAKQKVVKKFFSSISDG